jgi:hypothetical protein
MGGSGKYRSTYHELRPPGFLTRSVPEKVMDYGFNIAPAVVGTGVAAHHLSEGEHPGTALMAGAGAGVLASRKTWAGLRAPRGTIKTKFTGYGQGANNILGGGILGPTTTTYTPVVDNKAWRYMKGLAPAATMLSTPALTSTVGRVDESMRSNTERFALAAQSLAASSAKGADALVEGISGKEVRNPETGETELHGGFTQAIDILAPTIKERIDEGGVAAAIGPPMTKTIENLEETTEGLAALATSVAGALDKVSEAVATGADFAVANPKKLIALGGMYMLAAGGITGLIVWLRERNRRRTVEEQDKRHARQQKKMMKMVLDAQEEEEE